MLIKRAGYALLLVLGSATSGAQSPNTDIYLAPLHITADSIIVGRAINITHRTGYNNQPSFHPDARAILYTADDSAGRTDIWRYDIATKRTTRVTSTPESEYSPTVMPGGARFSVIRVERDSTQRLWSFALDGSDPQLVLRDLKPVGYHAWLDSTHLVAFVLGSPSTLHLIGRDGRGDTIVARDVGRSLARVPKYGGYGYTKRDGAGKLVLMYATSRDSAAVATIRAPDDNEFFAVSGDGVLLSASNGKLLRWNDDTGPGSAWKVVADLSANGVRNISRLAVSLDDRWLAFVAEPMAP